MRHTHAATHAIAVAIARASSREHRRESESQSHAESQGCGLWQWDVDVRWHSKIEEDGTTRQQQNKRRFQSAWHHSFNSGMVYC